MSVGINKEPLEKTSKSRKKHTLLIHYVGHRGKENINRWFVPMTFNVSSTQALHLDDDNPGLLFNLCISNLVCKYPPNYLSSLGQGNKQLLPDGISLQVPTLIDMESQQEVWQAHSQLRQCKWNQNYNDYNIKPTLHLALCEFFQEKSNLTSYLSVCSFMEVVSHQEKSKYNPEAEANPFPLSPGNLQY